MSAKASGRGTKKSRDIFSSSHPSLTSSNQTIILYSMGTIRSSSNRKKTQTIILMNRTTSVLNLQVGKPIRSILQVVDPMLRPVQYA